MADAPAAGGGGGGNDLLFFVGMILIFFLVWVSGGGPNRPASFSGPYLNGANLPTTPGSSGTSGSPVTLVNDPLSAKATNENKEYVTLFASPASGQGVSLAGWKIASASSKVSVAIPYGTNLPRSGSVNTLAPITLSPGDQAIIVSGRSPVGSSFRENKCTGYLEERQDFTPALSQSCPTPYEEMQRFSDDTSEKCATYVRSISYCSSETPSGNPGSSCEEFVDERLNYNGCVDAHKNDPDFYKPTWRIYLGQDDELWKANTERIDLINASGTVVGSLSY